MAYDKELFLYLTKEDDTAVVRFHGPKQELYQIFDIMKKTSTFHKNSPTAQADGTGRPAKRIVSLVIDRINNDKIKAFCCPSSVWNNIQRYVKNDFSFKNDFIIKRSGTGLNTKYDVQPLEETEVTEEQEKAIEATLSQYSFEDIYVKQVDWEILLEKPERVENRFELLDL